MMQSQEQKPISDAGPDNLRAGAESLSGFDMSAVRVHGQGPAPGNSANPLLASLGAEAYARGGDVHLGPGQEQLLPHEAWHVVQQQQGRVQPTMQL